MVEAPSGQPRACAYLLHGILGSRRNWLSFARRIVAAFPAWRLVLVDLRNHGESHLHGIPGDLPGPHTLDACARDLLALDAHLGPTASAALGTGPRAVIGHSFGGKVALAYADLRAPAVDAAPQASATLRDVWALDSYPGILTPSTRLGSVEGVLETIAAIPTPIAGRKSLVDALLARGLSQGIAQWMTTNLRPVEGGFAWRLHLPAVRDMLLDYGRQDAWPALEHPPPHLRVHFVRGGRSERWTAADIARLEGGRDRGLDLHTLEHAGHWLHTDDPEGVFACMAPMFASLDLDAHR